MDIKIKHFVDVRSPFAQDVEKVGYVESFNKLTMDDVTFESKVESGWLGGKPYVDVVFGMRLIKEVKEELAKLGLISDRLLIFGDDEVEFPVKLQGCRSAVSRQNKFDMTVVTAENFRSENETKYAEKLLNGMNENFMYRIKKFNELFTETQERVLLGENISEEWAAENLDNDTNKVILERLLEAEKEIRSAVRAQRATIAEGRREKMIDYIEKIQEKELPCTVASKIIKKLKAGEGFKPKTRFGFSI